MEEETKSAVSPETKEEQKEGSWWTVVLIIVILALLVEGAYVTLTNRVHQEPTEVHQETTVIVPSE